MWLMDGPFIESVHRPVLIRAVIRGFVDRSGLERGSSWWWREMSDLD
uniref:Uncharacterized protein n=1 Tax=Setaria italica TaxID=4555 RepID=K4A4K6_SETIT